MTQDHVSSMHKSSLNNSCLINDKYPIKDLIDIEKLRSILEDFSKATGFSISLVSHPEQNLFIDTGCNDIYQKFHSAHPESEKHYRQSNRDLIKNLKQHKELNIRRCENGLVDGATPIISRGVHIANLLVGQIFFEKPDIDHFRRQAQTYGYDMDAYLAAVTEVPIVSEDRLKSALISLSEIIMMIVEQEIHNLELNEERDKYKSIYDQSFHLIGLMTPDGILVDANQSSLEFGGFQPSDVIGKPFWETPWWTHSPAQQNILREAVAKAASGEFVRFEASHPTPDGAESCVDFSIKPVTDENGTVIYLIPEGREITERIWAERDLREEKRFSETALNSLPGLFYFFNEEGKFLRWNKNFEDVSGYLHEEIATMSALDFFAPENQEQTRLAIQKVFECGKNTMENLFLTKNGEQILYYFTGLQTIIDDRPYIVGTAIDITSRKQAEEERLAHSAFLENMNKIDHAIRGTSDIEQMMQNVLDTVFEIFNCDRTYLIYPCDPNATHFKVPVETTKPEYPGGLAIGKDYPMTPGTSQYCREALAADGPITLGQGNERPLNKEVEEALQVQSNIFMALHPKLGSPWVLGMHHCSHPHTWSKREIVLFNEIGRRITDGLSSMLFLRNLEESEEKYRLLFENADIFISIYDKNGVCLMMNQTAAKSFGGSPEDFIGKTFAEQDFEAAAEYTNRIRKAIKSENTEYYTDYVSLSEGDHYLTSTVMPVKNARGDVYAGMIISQDITERKQAEKALEEMNAIIEASPAVAFLWRNDDGWPVEQVSENVLTLIGYAAEEFYQLRVSYMQVIHPDDLERVSSEVSRFSRDENRKQFAHQPYRVVAKDGSIKWVEDRTTIRRNKTGEITHYQGIVLDITDRVQAEEALCQSEETFRALTENSLDTIMRFDRDHRHLYVNPIVEIQTGISPEQFIGKTHQELGFPEDLCQLWEDAINFVFENAKVHRIEFQLPNGTWVDWLIMPEFDDAEMVKAVIASARDITENKQAEDEKYRLEEQLRQSQKMESIGRLAGGVAHDFNNILTGINGFSEMIITSLSPDDPMRADMEEIKSAGDRAAELTNQLLAFSRKQIIAPKVIQPNEILEHSQKMLRRIIGEDIHLTFLPGEGLGYIKMDPAQLDQVLVNLAVNARDAMLGGGKLTIETQNVVLENEPVYVDGRVIEASGNYIMMAVADSGHGMTDETMEHIFEPFFSTKGKGKGTGLGLATVYGIARQNNGFISVYSKPDIGSTFKLFLPQVEEKREEPEADFKDHAPGGKETILLVEDEDMVRGLARKILARHGYQVIEAKDGEDACQVSAEHCGEIHLLLTDVIMPGMNGHELYEKLQSIKPGLKVLYMSGYTENAIAHHGVLEEDTVFLQKPFTIKSMTQKVRTLLDKKGA